MRVGLVRRGYSPSGGAERYLKRLGKALVDEEHQAVLFSSPEWPAAEWSFGDLIPIVGRSPLAFANKLERINPMNHCDVLYSLERVHRCDIYRAGDGVHKSWLQRRKRFEAPWRAYSRSLNRKHDELLSLERGLMADQQAGTIIVNSDMVRNEIVQHYGYPIERIRTVYNGVPMHSFQRSPAAAKRVREEFLLTDKDLLVLFAGSGWSRKGLKFAIKAVSNFSRQQRTILLVAGRGKSWRYASRVAHFMGEVTNMTPLLEAADVFMLPTTYDPFSNACLEAMAYGLPVITTRANGFHEIIEHKVDGWVVDDATQIDALVAGLEYWKDPDRRAAARESLPEKVARYSIETNLRQTLQAVGINA